MLSHSKHCIMGKHSCYSLVGLVRITLVVGCVWDYVNVLNIYISKGILIRYIATTRA